MMKQRWMAGVAMLVTMAIPGTLGAAVPATGTWVVAGNVQGVPVNMSCALTVAADNTVSGSCIGDDTKTRSVTGTVKDQTLTWSFNSEYEGSPITVTLSGVVDDSGAKMSGTIYVDPMNADGDFNASLKPQAS